MRSDIFADVWRGAIFDRVWLDVDEPVFALASFAGHASSGFRWRATRSLKGEAWWSQTESNRRPHACKARALPAELWPRMFQTTPVSAFQASPGTLRSCLAWLRHAQPKAKRGGPGKT